MRAYRGLALSGLADSATISRAAGLAETCGYDAVWATVIAGTTDPAATLAALAAETSAVQVGLGLVPLEALDVEALAAIAATIGPRAITIALGAGGVRQDSASRVLDAARSLRSQAPEVEIVVGGYGTTLLATAGASADAVLLNWTNARHARDTQALVAAGRAADLSPLTGTGARPTVRTYAYVPTFVGVDAGARRMAALDAMGARSFHLAHQDTYGRENLGIACPDAAAARTELATVTDFLPIVLPYLAPGQDLDQVIRDLSPSAQ